MCMLKLSSKLYAKEDIVCYKILRQMHIGDMTTLKSLLNDYRWVIGKRERASRSKARYDNKIYDGYFHSYREIPKKLPHISPFLDAMSVISIPVIYKCIIPKGSLYYEGIHSDALDGYCSKSLVVVEKVL